MIRSLLLTLVAAAAFVAPAAAGTQAGTQSDAQTALRLSQLTGANVACFSGTWNSTTLDAGHAGAKGLYDTVANQILLSPEVCAPIAAFQQGFRPQKQVEVYKLAEAIFVLGHEAGHASGIVDETGADCHSAQTMKATSRALGASKAYAALLWSYAAPYVAGRC
jgi:hypothetical protein